MTHETTLPMRRVTTLRRHGASWHLTVACPANGTVDADSCAACDRLREMLPPDEEGRSWIVCDPEVTTHDAKHVRDLMKADVLCVQSALSVRDAMGLFRREGFTWAPVVDDAGAVIGVISMADIMRLDLPDQPIGPLMSPTITISDDATVPAAARTMANAHVHTAPVINGQGRVVGVLSALDLLRWMVGLWE